MNVFAVVLLHQLLRKETLPLAYQQPWQRQRAQQRKRTIHILLQSIMQACRWHSILLELALLSLSKRVTRGRRMGRSHSVHIVHHRRLAKQRGGRGDILFT